MPIPTEPIGSIPRPPKLIAAIKELQEGRPPNGDLNALYDEALRDTIRQFEATESPMITDGEQTGARAKLSLASVVPVEARYVLIVGLRHRLLRLAHGQIVAYTVGIAFLRLAQCLVSQLHR